MKLLLLATILTISCTHTKTKKEVRQLLRTQYTIPLDTHGSSITVVGYSCMTPENQIAICKTCRLAKAQEREDCVSIYDEKLMCSKCYPIERMEPNEHI